MIRDRPDAVARAVGREPASGPASSVEDGDLAALILQGPCAREPRYTRTNHRHAKRVEPEPRVDGGRVALRREPIGVVVEGSPTDRAEHRLVRGEGAVELPETPEQPAV